MAINQNGDIVITLSALDNSVHSYLYSASTGLATEINPPAGSSGVLAAALNSKDQVVGKGYLYSNGITQAHGQLVASEQRLEQPQRNCDQRRRPDCRAGDVQRPRGCFLDDTGCQRECRSQAAFAIWGLIATCGTELHTVSRLRRQPDRRIPDYVASLIDRRQF